jgi:hypothetical protein
MLNLILKDCSISDGSDKHCENIRKIEICIKVAYKYKNYFYEFYFKKSIVEELALNVYDDMI